MMESRAVAGGNTDGIDTSGSNTTTYDDGSTLITDDWGNVIGCTDVDGNYIAAENFGTVNANGGPCLGALAGAAGVAMATGVAGVVVGTLAGLGGGLACGGSSSP